VVIFFQRGSFEPAYQVATIAVTAAAMGDEVTIVFAFDALKALARDALGLPAEKERSASTRAEGLGLPTPAKLLAEARALGVRLVACDTTVKLCGLAPRSLEGKLDETLGLASIWRFTQGARVLTF
jgi:peroxiredoxin family protein